VRHRNESPAPAWPPASGRRSLSNEQSSEHSLPQTKIQRARDLWWELARQGHPPPAEPNVIVIPGGRA
jgi:hypothetical protein